MKVDENYEYMRDVSVGLVYLDQSSLLSTLSFVLLKYVFNSNNLRHSSSLFASTDGHNKRALFKWGILSMYESFLIQSLMKRAQGLILQGTE